MRRVISVGLVHGTDGVNESADFLVVLLAGFAFDAGGNIDTPGAKDVDGFLHVTG